MTAESEKDQALEIFRLEYERAAERYENIIKEIWQNFYYMAVIAGGILAFGPGEDLSLSLLAAIALIPLVVWFWATYLPMDRIGQLTRARLAFIEHILNKVFLESELGNEPLTYIDTRLGKIQDLKRLRHYQLFYEPKPVEAISAEPDEDENIRLDRDIPTNIIRPTYRVRTIVCVFGAVVTNFCILFLGWSLGLEIATRTNAVITTLIGTLIALTLIWITILAYVFKHNIPGILGWCVGLIVLSTNLVSFLIMV